MPTDSHDDILSAAQSEASFEPSAAPRAALAPKIDKLKAQLDAALGTHDKGAA